MKQLTAAELYREEVLRAKRLSMEQKLLLGPQLFDYACRITADGLRSQHPGASEQEVLRILRERLALGRRLELCKLNP